MRQCAVRENMKMDIGKTFDFWDSGSIDGIPKSIPKKVDSISKSDSWGDFNEIKNGKTAPRRTGKPCVRISMAH